MFRKNTHTMPPITRHRVALRAACLPLLVAAALPICASPRKGLQPGASGSQPTTEQLKFYDELVKPVLKTACYSCHGGGANISGDLNLMNRASILKGGSSGPAIDLKSPSD